jgi:hypothetical protein
MSIARNKRIKRKKPILLDCRCEIRPPLAAKKALTGLVAATFGLLFRTLIRINCERSRQKISRGCILISLNSLISLEHRAVGVGP